MSERGLRKALDDEYEAGRRFALAGIPPNCGPTESGRHDRYREMAHVAGWQQGLKEKS